MVEARRLAEALDCAVAAAMRESTSIE